MELLIAIVIGVLFGGGTYLILRPSLIRVVMGLALYSNAANLVMIACGGYSLDRTAPFVDSDTNSISTLMDPLPPDFILTAIVISFAVNALFLIGFMPRGNAIQFTRVFKHTARSPSGNVGCLS